MSLSKPRNTVDEPIQLVYDTGLIKRKNSIKYDLNAGQTISVCSMNCIWTLVRIPQENDQKFGFGATLTSHYEFNDDRFLHIILKKDDNVFFEEEFKLEKCFTQQNFEIEYNESMGEPFDEIKTCAFIETRSITYVSDVWATEIDLKDSGRAHDVVLIAGETKFYVHRLYLATWSPYFDKLFFGEYKEKGQKEIVLEEVDAIIFEHVLDQVYPKLSAPIQDDKVVDILELAAYLEIPKVMAQCGTILANFSNCSKLSEIDRLELADTHNLVHLQVACFNRIRDKNADERINFFHNNRARIRKLSEKVAKNLF